MSKSQILLLALSTRADKFEGVRKTIEFSDIITKISNPPCDSSLNMVGGYNTNIKNNVKNNVKNNIKNNLKTKYILRKINNH